MSGQAQIVTLGTKLTDVQTASLKIVTRDVPGTLGVVAMPNIEKIDSANILPSGTVICVKRDAQLDISLLPDKMFSIMALYPVVSAKNEVDVDDEYFRSRMTVEKGRRIEENFGDGPSFVNTILSGIGVHPGTDRKNWQPTLGSGFWSICKFEEELYNSQYYVAVYVPKTKLSTEFVNRAAEIAQNDAHSHSGVHSTFKDILELPEYPIATRLARRNASKIALQVASAFDVIIQHTLDKDAPVSLNTLAQPMIALPTHVTQFNHFDAIKVSTKTPSGTRLVDAIAIYNGCGSMNESIGGVVIPVSPRLGVDLYPKMKRVLNYVQNSAVNAVPQGRSSIGQRELRTPDLRFNEYHVFWNSKRGKAVHPKMKVSYTVDSDEEIERFLPKGAAEERQRLSHVIEYLGEIQTHQ